MRMQITFKSGAQVEVDVTKFSTQRDPLGGGDLVGLSWENPADASRKLNYIRLDEVVCVAALYTANATTGPTSVEVSANAVPAHDEG
jgi:hypothetical protein